MDSGIVLSAILGSIIGVPLAAAVCFFGLGGHSRIWCRSLLCAGSRPSSDALSASDVSSMRLDLCVPKFMMLRHGDGRVYTADEMQQLQFVKEHQEQGTTARV